MFDRVQRRETAVDQCETALRRAILTGELKAGEQLPPERTLAESFGVNRITVRSALSRLVAANLVRARQGSGHLVADYHQAGGPGLLPALAELAEEDGSVASLAEDLLLVRRKLAAAVFERLAARARLELDPQWLSPITRAVDALAAAADSGGPAERLAQLDGAILATVVEATQSPALRLCLNPVLEVAASLPPLRDAMLAEPSENVAGYRMLIAGLAQPFPDLSPLDDALRTLDERTLDRLRRATSRATLPPPRPRGGP
jgi:GntR family transcriptional repressor for pyruvate dehydrogenase complex